MTAFDGLSGARALRRARTAVRHYPGEVEAVPDRLWLLGANPVGRFTVGAGQMADASIEASLASIDGSRIESEPLAAPPRARSVERDRPTGRRPTAGRTTPFERAGVDRSSTRPDVEALPGSEASRPAMGPQRLVSRGRSSVVAADADVAERDRPPLPRAGQEMTAARSVPSWVARAARRGGMTPVRIFPLSGDSDIAAGETVVARTNSGAHGSATLSSLETIREGTTAGSASERSAVPRLALASTGLRSTLAQSGTPSGVAPPTRLAGLARWWDETHAPSELHDRKDSHDSTAPGGSIERTPTVGARRDGEIQDVYGNPSATVLDLRAQFGELLEAALLDGARADGIEVRP